MFEIMRVDCMLSVSVGKVYLLLFLSNREYGCFMP